MLEDLFDEVQKQMKSKFEEIKKKFSEPHSKGLAVEKILREFLREYLPRRLEISYGRVIDANGRESRQTDVVILNEDHPFTYPSDEPGLFFIEGVSAAGEVKSKLTNTKQLENAIESSKVFKQLKIVKGRRTYYKANPSDKRFYDSPPYFLFTFDSRLKLSTIKNRLENNIGDEKIMDAVFVLNKGWIIDFGDGRGAFQLRDKKERIEGWYFKESGKVLLDFLGWLHIVMPRFMRYDPILAMYHYYMGYFKKDFIKMVV